MRHEAAIFGQKIQIQKFQLSFFAFLFSFNNKKTPTLAETPIFKVV